MNAVSDYTRIEKAIHYLTANSEAQPSLADLSEFLGLSEFHCHRLFKRWAGITPKDFLQVLTLAKSKELLKNSKSLLETSMNVGVSGPSRLHDLFLRYEAMTPGEYKTEGLAISWSMFDSPLGRMAVAATDRGICALTFDDDEAAALREFAKHWPRARISKSSRALKPLTEEIVRRLTDEPRDTLNLHLCGSAFQVKVWQALLTIPEGQVTTYQRLAKRIGALRASRAVGSAVGANPIGYLIPCHRVIKSTGAVGEYHWGSARKTALLALEHSR